MKVKPVNQDFPTFQTHTIKNIGSAFGPSLLVYEEKMDGFSDAYYTLLGPLLIAFIGMRSDKTIYRKIVPGVSFLLAIGYILFSSFIQDLNIEELIIDEKKQVFQRQFVPQRHDSKTERTIQEVIPFNQIASVQYLTCELENNKKGYELNLVLNNGKRINVFTHRDATMAIDANVIAHIMNKPLLEPECFINQTTVESVYPK